MAAYEILKEVVSAYTVHWYGILGIIFIFMTIYMPHRHSGELWTGRARIALAQGTTPVMIAAPHCPAISVNVRLRAVAP